ncbi:unnamed protein product [Staurois parvus]|uniref:Uncharacterized protein n=1 Tax=Staurois parvus TaxID=386267 RepID=A0ABN9AL18_9NEOB|nr:unnamed protein product [Staurois parvus]
MQSSVLTVKHKHSTQLIASHVNPFMPSAIITVSVLFISTDHCIGVAGDVSDTKLVPPSVRIPLQSRYKPLIAAITSNNKTKTIHIYRHL